MKQRRVTLRKGLACAALAALAMIVAPHAHGDRESCGKDSKTKPALALGNGYSDSKDAGQAGAEAAEKAKQALGKAEARVVLVFDTVAADKAAKEAMLKGVASVFDASMIYGCSSYAPLTQDSNTGTVAVLAIGGQVHVAAALADLEGGHKACGERIGEALKEVEVQEGDGRLVLLFGSCHVPKNNDLVAGVHGVLGEKYGVAGGAASKGEFVYHKGKLVDKKSNLGVLLSGGFKCSFAAGKGDGIDGVIASAGEACKTALGESKDKTIAVFAFDCGGRRGTLKDGLAGELQAMKDVIGNVPLFGFYGSGETGPKDNDSPPKGVGYHVIICALLAK